MLLSAFTAASLVSSAARSQDVSDLKSDSEQTKKERAVRLETMRRHAASLSVKVETDGAFVEAEVIDVPLLHFNNPAGETLDATVWAWGKRGRPAVLASLSQEKGNVNVEKWSCELLSLADKAVQLEARPGWKWTPKTSGIDWKPVADAPAVGTTPVQRAVQMKEIARRYSATGIYQDRNQGELRLMDRPLSRYSDPEHGLVDGALYAFAAGTNPEVLLLVECRQAAGEKPAWFHGFARMGAGKLVARLGETTVWERAAIRSWNPREPYFSSFGPLDAVFGSESPASK
jgi:hypothetical protein